MHADNVSDFKDFGMVLQLITEDGAADLLVGLISNLQAGAEVCGKKTYSGQSSNVKSQGLNSSGSLNRVVAYQQLFYEFFL